MGKFIDLSGQKFGRLTVLNEHEIEVKSSQRVTKWLCKCDCGNIIYVRASALRNGTTSSCGCYHKQIVGNINRKHNLSHKTRLYRIWKGIKERCYNKNNKSYKNYGGRGITVCDDWKNNFMSFYNWAIKNGYKEEIMPDGKNKWTIDRIDNYGNYEPSNCRWITNKEQSQNKRNSLLNEEKYTKCSICGKDIIQNSRNKQKTCSYECAVKLRTQNHFKETKDKYKKLCVVCGKEFEDRSGHFKRSKCCSKKCASLLKSPIWEFNGEKNRVSVWAEILGISAHCLLHRKEIGWDIERILTTPKGKIIKNAKL